MERLPEGFREALQRRTLRTAAVGWPVSVFQTPEGTACIPGLIVPVTWRIDGADLRIIPEAVEPSLNPAWLQRAARNSKWNQEQLLETLLNAEEQGLAGIGDRIRYALATLGAGELRPADLAQSLPLSSQGVRNAAALFLSEDATFTKGAAADLESLASLPAEALQDSALYRMLVGGSSAGDPIASPIPISDLTDSQLLAADACLAGPLTVVQGPPGTGKSQLILTLLASAVLNGRSVLFAAKNHQALNEVEKRLAELISDVPLLVRGRDAEGERDVSFLDVMAELAREEAAQSAGAGDVDDQLKSVVDAAARAGENRRRMHLLQNAHSALSELADRQDAPEPKRMWGHASRLNWLLALFRRIRAPRPQNILDALPAEASLASVQERRGELRALIARTTAELESGKAEAKQTFESALGLLRKVAALRTKPNAEQWRRISDRYRDLDFNRVKRSTALSAADAADVVRHRPIWAMSTLSVPSRIPLIPGLFDYVVFDEASQCDVASALPLLARARRAVIVGDPMQLRFIPSLSNRTEHALMDAAGLPKTSRFDFAQSTNSLFDFASRRTMAQRCFLRDQFRSAPAIVDYLNADFYQGRLVGRRENDFFNPPKAYKPGLAWEDVQGLATREDGGTVNADEAKRICDLLADLAADDSFRGSVGVLSPFNAQVALITREVSSRLSVEQRKRLALHVATIDKFQGGEADVIFFSLVLTRSAPFSARTFLSKERRRLNVAISRARAVCIVVGDLEYAQRCGIKHIEYLSGKANGNWSPPRAPFDSLWERRLDTAMRNRGLQPVPQYPVGSKYLDFALDPDGAKINIEVDGRRWHTDADGERKVSDRIRDEEMRARGWRVMRFWVHELQADMGGCIDRIQREYNERRAAKS
ncbi:AAA domain-containing protein [Devosia sp. RR2S18]|uniref:AAA domain-containing protein n=1 Tax=Devosia rhizosphaerae TaxID=3049774 RepID=UPI002542327A|nr:AAA domain-containing protein [Devosia sp. RR2S18]WIJ25793.1 AAA domain-containing protein [Devosia sp. RR2S18]